MSGQDEEFIRLLEATFRTEAEEHLQAVSAGLQKLEKAAEAEQTAIVETVYREAHSLKGASRAVNRTDIEQVFQAMESVLSAWKRGVARPAAGDIATLQRAADAVAGSVAAGGSLDAVTVYGLVNGLGAVLEKPGTAAAAPATTTPAQAVPEKPAAVDSARVPLAKLDEIIRDIEEFLPARLAAALRVSDLHELEGVLERWRAAWSGIYPRIRDAQSAADRNSTLSPAELVHLLEFLDWNHHHFRLIEEKLRALSRAATHDRRDMEKRVDDLVEGSRQLALLPCNTMLAVLPKIVRDVARDQGKQAALEIHGSEVELDKHVLEALKDPLVHIIRNCVDHGIEPPSERERNGKPAAGVIRIAISQAESGRVGIVVSDDGGGINVTRLKEAAVKQGAISGADAARLSGSEALQLIFSSGVSTSPVTNISGRGLGMAIVREKTEKLGGTVEVESWPGRGTTFRLSVPLTRATFRGVVVHTEGHAFIIPTGNMERVIRAGRDEIKTVESRETLVIDGHPMSLVRLADLLELAHRKNARHDHQPVVVLRSGEKRIALGVEEVLYETEVLLKPLGPPLVRVRNVSAATVLGGGQVVPVLNISDLFESAARLHGAPALPEPAPLTTRKGSLLVVEDSITARMLLKNILESAGYRVKTAVDGVDALTNLRTDEFDLVVSDVDMPRMNGLELVSRIRADRRLGETPVILVTALASQEDRERGAQAGASAYIVKSSFDQSNLLAAIERLL